MTDKPWKRHERETARYFRVPRRVRGNDFSVSDVEVLVNVDEWLSKEVYRDSFIIVECKYRKENGIVTLFNEQTKGIKSTTPVLRVGEFFLCKLEDFKDFFIDLVINDLDIIKLSEKYTILRNDKKEPKYLREYTEQAEDYGEVLDKHSHYISTVCMARASTAGRLMAISCSVIESYRELITNERLDKQKEKEEGTTGTDL